MSSTPSQLQQERYGRSPLSPARRGRVVAVGVVVLLAALAWITWISVFRQPTVRWQDVGFAVSSPAQVTVTFDVFFSGDTRSAVCTVQAQNELHTDVGLKDVTLHPGPQGRVRAVVTLPTSERATTGLVKDCSAASE